MKHNELKEFQTPIETLNLSTRAYMCLKRSDINYIEQAVKLNRKDFMKMRNFGKKCLTELTVKLKSLGFDII